MDLDIEKIIREYIDKSWHLSLATSAENKPWVCEVHFCYDGNLNLYFVSKRSTRHCTEIANNSFVAGNIVAQHQLSDSPSGVYFEGRAHLIDSPSQEELKTYCSRLGREVEELKSQLQDGQTSGMYKIEVSNWAAFGKFGLEKNSKHELVWNGGQK